VDGLDVCRELRRTSQVPIIMLTARGEEIDRVVGLELGADDYLAKPFSVRELLARIKAVLRRAQGDASQPEPEEVLSGPGGLRMAVAARAVTVGGASVDLTRLEFDLLYHLLSNPGRVLTREQLLERAWGYAYAGDTRAVDSAVKRLRLKLRRAAGVHATGIHADGIGREADPIETVRGVGYRLVV
jgi:DNA-binding response OmpR family regulator